MAADTVYGLDAGTAGDYSDRDPRTTQYAYNSWYPNSTQVQSLTVSQPTISSAQNGPGAADSTTIFFDSQGRPVWTKDPDGHIGYEAYDTGTGELIKMIQDVNYSQLSTAEQNSFNSTGWSPPMSGLHLVTTMQVDSLGRVTEQTDPNNNLTYTVYLDPNHEMRTYPGWDPAAHTTTGPIQVQRQYWPAAGAPVGQQTVYDETLTSSATPTYDLTSNAPTGQETINQTNIQTLARDLTNSGGQVVESDAYFSLAGVTYSSATAQLGTASNNSAAGNYHATLYGYDQRGRPNRMQAPTGTISRTVYDALSRVASSWIGTNDTGATDADPSGGGAANNNMVQVSANTYDGGGVGDSDLTSHVDYPTPPTPGNPNPTDQRETDYLYDWRDRPVVAKQGVQASESTSTHRPIFYAQFDNLDEGIASEHYDGDGVPLSGLGSTNGVPNRPDAAKLRAKTTTGYDDQGRVFRTSVFSVDQTNGTVSANSLRTNNWYDHRGNLIKTSQPGGLVTKAQYDGTNRAVKVFTTDDVANESWTDAGTVANNRVLTQTETFYDSNGNPLVVTTRDRFHNATALGDLSGPNPPQARTSYVQNFYDAANRLFDRVDVGTNGGAIFNPFPAPPTASSDGKLVTLTAYNAAGWVQDVTDPRGLVRHTAYDLLGRTTKVVEAFQGDGTPTNTTNRTTAYTYDGADHLLTLTAVLPAGVTQATQYAYGVTPAAGSALSSNDLLATITYPANGQPNTEGYTYNALGQATTKTERNVNTAQNQPQTHAYGYDVLGRPTTDTVTVFGTGVDGTIARLETAYDTGGRPSLFTSYRYAGGLYQVLNQVQRVFNGLGQLVAEYQAHNGIVLGSTPSVQYTYSFDPTSGGANHSRLVSITYPASPTYPTGRVISYNYAAGLDDAISRLTAVADGATVLEQYSYLGLDTVVRRARPQPGVDLSYLQQPGDSGTGDGGDQYAGLDRFGRVVDQRWLPTANPQAATDRFQYAYDYDSNPLYRNNLVNPAFGELYHASGPGQGYDNFNQLTAFGRGTLSASQTGGPLDTVTGTHSQSWTLDALGNWTSFTNDGNTQARTHNAQNQITSLTPGPPPAYDANGNTTADDQGTTYTYDAWNRLVQASTATGVVTYGYDALGRRVKVTAGGATTDLYYSSSWQVVEEQVAGQMQAQYVWSPMYVDALIERDTAGGQRLYVQQDANWNVTALVDTLGVVQERYAYDPYGKPTFLAGNWTVLSGSAFGWVYLHQGGRYDPVSGLYYYRNRDLSPTLGRWMQQDPVGYRAGDMNLYRYVGGNPATFLDPTGTFTGVPAPPVAPPSPATLCVAAFGFGLFVGDLIEKTTGLGSAIGECIGNKLYPADPAPLPRPEPRPRPKPQPQPKPKRDCFDMPPGPPPPSKGDCCLAAEYPYNNPDPDRQKNWKICAYKCQGASSLVLIYWPKDWPCPADDYKGWIDPIFGGHGGGIPPKDPPPRPHIYQPAPKCP